VITWPDPTQLNWPAERFYREKMLREYRLHRLENQAAKFKAMMITMSASNVLWSLNWPVQLS